MKKGNVLVIGNSGVGKSTLINAIFKENIAVTGWGLEGNTQELTIHESETLPFRIIDSKGFEPASPMELLTGNKAVKAVKKWSAECAKLEKDDHGINIIWFCVDGGTSKLFPKYIEDFCKATSIWKSVPVIAVITKSTVESQIQDNIQMVRDAFAKVKKDGRSLAKIIPVVAKPFIYNENAIVPEFGLEELIEATNQLMPKGLEAAQKDIASFTLNLKRIHARSLTMIATASAVTVGAVPLPIPDNGVLIGIETAMVNQIAKIYEVSNKDKKNSITKTIIEAGTVGVIAKTAIKAIKAIPGIAIAASVLDAIVAGVIVASLGGVTAHIYEKVYLGEIRKDDTDFVKKILENQSSAKIFEAVNHIVDKLSKGAAIKELPSLIIEAIYNLGEKKQLK